MNVREHEARRLGLILSDVVLSLKELQRRRDIEARRRELLRQINDMKSISGELKLEPAEKG